MFVLMTSSLKLGKLISETSSPGQIKGKTLLMLQRSHFLKVIIMNRAQMFVLMIFKVMYSFLSSDSLKFFRFRSVSQ